MRRIPFILLTLLAAGTASAQQLPASFTGPGARSVLTTDAVVARLMTFDGDRDGRITAAELDDRMRGVVARGDRDGDHALDATEITALAASPLQPVVRTSFSPGMYVGTAPFATTSRLQIEGAIDDLRLDSATRERVLAVIDDYFARHQAPALARVREFLSGRLPADRFDRFMRLLESRHRAAGPVPLSRFPAFLTTTTELGQLVEQLPLPDVEREEIALAIDAFDAEVRVDDGVRLALETALAGVLNHEQHDDLRAALQRPRVVGFPAAR